MLDWRQYITSDPEVLAGKPRIRDTRIAVDLIIEKLASGEPVQQILESYPHLKEVEILACLAFAVELMRKEIHVSKAS